MNFILPLISFGSFLGDLGAKLFFMICMMIFGVFYRLVAYSFRVFQLMCGVNMNAVSQISEPLVNRLQSVIIVFVVYMIGVSFIQFMLDPDKALEGGKKILINLFIATALFISYNTIFSVFNELNIAIMGNPSGYRYTTLGEWFNITDEDGNGEADNGLIIRFLFNETEIDDPGQSIALSLAGLFLRDSSGGGNRELLNSVCKDTDGKMTCDFSRLHKKIPEKIVDDKIDYTFLIGSVVALFVIYSMFKNAFEVAIRMFKLMIMQLLAPIVIVDVIKNGVKDGKFKTYCSKYISIFLEAFVRMLTVLVITVFVSQFLIHLPSYFPALQTDEGFFTKLVLTVIIIIAAYTFAGQVPKFIDEVIGTHMADSAGKGGFGKFLGRMVGGTLGAVGGLAAGAAAGGVAGAFAGLAGGAVRGIKSGGKGENIADFFKNNAEVQNKNREKSRQIARQGGVGAYIGHGIEHALGRPQAQQHKLDIISDKEKAFENMMSARADALKDEKYTTASGQQIKYGASADEFISSALEYDGDVAAAQAAFENTKKGAAFTWTDATGRHTESGTPAAIKAAQTAYMAAREKAKDQYKEEYNKQLFENAAVNGDKSVQEATTVYDRRADSGRSSSDLTRIAAGSRPSLGSKATGDAIKATRKAHSAQKQDMENRGALRRENRQGKF